MRMSRLIRWVMLIVPGWAGAIDMDYYTYNAFEETVAAFQRVSLVLQDPAFTVFVLIFAVAGVLVGGLVVGARGMQGRAVNPIAFMIPVLVGVALFRGFVFPTGNLFIYDPVRNATQAVGDVPDAIVLMAGTLNKLERGVVEIIETASADPDAERSGALRYSLILNALNARGTNISLERNLVNYYLDCGLPSMSLGFNGASQQEAERNTPDLYETFARFAHPSFATFAYTGAGDSTSTMTCATMWTDILNPALNGAGALGDVRDVICTKTGFDMTVPTQQARCDGELRSLGVLYGLTPASSLPFIRSSQIAIAMTNALRSGDISVQTGALVNRQVMAEGIGVAEALDRWVPKVRGFMTAAVLGMVPLSLLFVVTPLMGKALQLLAGLFLWLALWGVADAVSVSMAADAAADSFNQINQYGFAHMSFMLSPEGAVQSLGVFGKARAMALMMATVLSYALFQFGGYAFTNMANSWQNDVQQMGESAGRTAMMPEERAALMQRMTSSPAAEGNVNQYGFAAMAGGAAIGGAQQAREAQRASPYVSAGLNGAADMSNPSSSGSDVPELGAHGNTAPMVGSGAQSQHAGRGLRSGSIFDNYVNPGVDIRTGETLGRIDSREELSGRRGTGLFDVTRAASRFADVQSTESTLTEKSNLAELGFDAQASGAQSGQVTAGRAAAQREILGEVARNESVESDSAAAAQSFGRQERGEMIGALRGARTDDYVAAAEQRTIRSVAEGQQQRRDGSAARIGAADAIAADVSAQALQRALVDFTRRELIQGQAYGRMGDAARGAEVFDSENPGEVARALANLNVAEQLAHLDVARRMGNVLGIDTSTDEGARRFMFSKEGANQSVTVSADADAKERLIEALDLDAKASATLRSHSGGVKLSVAIDESGDVAFGAITAGGQTSLVDTTSIERGFTERANYAYSVSGGRALINERELLASELSRVWGDDPSSGQYDDTRLTGIANGIALYLSEGGQSMTASDFESVVLSASARVTAEGSFMFVSASASAGVEKSDADQRAAAYNLTYAYSRDAVIVAQKDAVEAFREEHGRNPNTAIERAAIFSEMAGRIQTTMEGIHEELLEQTKGAADGHDLAAPGDAPPAPPMSDPDYANYRAPISRR